jgi:hypothetical protein
LHITFANETPTMRYFELAGAHELLSPPSFK